MLMRRGAIASLLCWTLACGDGGGDGGSTTSTTSPTSTSPTTTDASSSSATTTAETSTGPAGSSSSGAESSSSGPADSSEGTTAPACDPPVVGEWNACVDENGEIDNTLCNWMGSGGSVGFLTCLSAASNPDANVCIIRDCVDACDCFDPPTTGTAVVICDTILADDQLGCALECSDGKICPDGMTCLDNLCFWVPA